MTLLETWNKEIGDKVVHLIEDSPYADEGYFVLPSKDGTTLIYGLERRNGTMCGMGSVKYNPSKSLKEQLNEVLEKAYGYGGCEPKTVIFN